MYCPDCGKVISDGSKFCQHCGFKILNSSVKPPRPSTNSKQKAVGSGRSLKTDRKTWLTIIFIVFIGFVCIMCITAMPKEKSFSNKDAFAMSKDIVREQLSSPISAVFCEINQARCSYDPMSDLWTVKGWVDSKDNKDAYVRQFFTATFQIVKDSQGKFVCEHSSVQLS